MMGRRVGEHVSLREVHAVYRGGRGHLKLHFFDQRVGDHIVKHARLAFNVEGWQTCQQANPGNPRLVVDNSPNSADERPGYLLVGHDAQLVK